MPVIDPLELIRHTFLMDKENGQRHHARILNVINEEEICKHIGKHKRELFSQPGHVQFVYSVNDDDYEEILSYNELMDYIEKDEQQHQDEDTNGFWNFKHIVGHEGPFIELPIQNTRVLDTMFLLSGRMGRSHLNLSISLAREGWNGFKGIAKCEKKMIDTYIQLYGEKPRKALSPLEQNDHPEMDDSPFLRQDETAVLSISLARMIQ